MENFDFVIINEFCCRHRLDLNFLIKDLSNYDFHDLEFSVDVM